MTWQTPTATRSPLRLRNHDVRRSALNAALQRRALRRPQRRCRRSLASITMRITVLGSAAGGGFPQWNCNCRNCAGVRAGTRARASRAPNRRSSSRPDDGADGVLVNASPDILEQIRATPRCSRRARCATPRSPASC